MSVMSRSITGTGLLMLNSLSMVEQIQAAKHGQQLDLDSRVDFVESIEFALRSRDAVDF